MRAGVVDSLAALVFFTVVATASERLIAGMGWGQVAAARRGRLGRSAIDVAAFMTFQVPVYAAILALAGASAAQAAAALSSATVLMLVLSRPFGVFLDACRRLAGMAPPLSRGRAPHIDPTLARPAETTARPVTPSP